MQISIMYRHLVTVNILHLKLIKNLHKINSSKDLCVCKLDNRNLIIKVTGLGRKK